MFTIADVLAATGGSLQGSASVDCRLSGVAVDSRQVKPGDLFVALRGQQRDGHDFVGAAFANGASGALVARIPFSDQAAASAWAGRPLVVVDDPLRALQRLAHAWRQRHRVTVVGVTGSVGKTTTKETVAAVLGQRYRVLKSQGNYNTEIGVPMTLMGLEAEHDQAVLEMGMLALGEIRQLAEIARPDIGIVTNVQPSHLERLGTMERIAQAKGELVEALPTSGLAVLNVDDPRVRAMAGRSAAPVRWYGLSEEAEVRATDVVSQGLQGTTFRLWHRGEAVQIEQPLVGLPGVYAALAAACVGLACGLELDEIATALRRVAPSLRIRVEPGVEGTRLIDDTYNANPASMQAALQLLSELEGRKIAVLGDMLELGSYEDDGHRQVGACAARVVDVLVTVGPRSALIAQAARAAQLPGERIFEAATNEEAIALLRQHLRRGDNVLVKGSRAMQMEEIVRALREDH